MVTKIEKTFLSVPQILNSALKQPPVARLVWMGTVGLLQQLAGVSGFSPLSSSALIK